MMAFNSEDDLQVAIHEDPGLILRGMPDVDPELCEDSPQLLSLGREGRLDSGDRIDNLFIDVNGILTFVECKLYDNKDLKRNVYPQALNYAAGLAVQLADSDGEEFVDEFSNFVSGLKCAEFTSLEGVMDKLKDDPIFRGRDLSEWRSQFANRLERNVKQGICRIVILCAPTRKFRFRYPAVRNLMQIMTFAETSGAKYELILMELRDIRDKQDYSSRMVWRRCAALPRIPLVAKSSRDTTKAIEAMEGRQEDWAEAEKQRLGDLIEALDDEGIGFEPDSRGYALYKGLRKERKSTYVLLKVSDDRWEIIRSQINEGEELHDKVRESDDHSLTEWLGAVCRKEQKDKTKNQYRVTIQPGSSRTGDLVDAIKKLRHRPQAEASGSR